MFTVFELTILKKELLAMGEGEFAALPKDLDCHFKFSVMASPKEEVSDNQTDKY